jgi:hypothetical protein
MEDSGMKRARFKKNRRQRKCQNCKEFYSPDAGNRWHQKYCTKPACRTASKHAAQKRWLTSQKGQGYFQGAHNVTRVQQWRECNPGYWKRHGPKGSRALQDFVPAQILKNQPDRRNLVAGALQDVVSAQVPLLIGLIANLTGTTLQDVIAETSRRFIVSGRDILGVGP